MFISKKFANTNLLENCTQTGLKMRHEEDIQRKKLKDQKADKHSYQIELYFGKEFQRKITLVKKWEKYRLRS